MKTVSPWFFVKDLLEDFRIDNKTESFNDEDFSFWGVIEYNKKYYVPMCIYNEYYALEMLNCYPTDIRDEKLPAGAKRSELPEENEEAVGIAYKRVGDNYCIRIWINVEEYLRKYYQNSEYITKKSEINESVRRCIDILNAEESPLYYQIEKEMPPLIFIYDRDRVINEGKELLIEIVKDELSRNLHGM